MSNLNLLETGGSEHSIQSLKIAVEGCGHGSMDNIYDSLEIQCESRGWAVEDVDFLIICGDFQEKFPLAVRNELDLNCMSVPWKYRHLGDFHRYYSGEKHAQVLTLVIGGNHEASNYFSELYYGGWLAPNIYYLGAANVLRYGPYRISGLSGIFKASDYGKSHHERLPYGRAEIRSIYHVRECDVAKLLQIQHPIDICISHDWPRRMEWFGDYKKLFADRPTFFESVKADNLGSPPAEQLMNLLRPKYWFSGHMHVKYSAIVEHKETITEDIFKDMTIPDEVRAQLPKSMFRASSRKRSGAAITAPKDITNDVTHFLALDKPGPDRAFLEFLDIDPCSGADDKSIAPYIQKTPRGKYALHYDEEWLAITRSSGHVSTDTSPETSIVAKESTILQNLSWVQTNITAKGVLKIPENFERHAPIYDPSVKGKASEQPCEFPNSQTKLFCKMLEIPDPFSGIEDRAEVGDYIVFE